MKYLILKNNFQIPIEDYSEINNMFYINSNREEALNILNSLTPQNIQTIKILNDNSQFEEKNISNLTFITAPSLSQQIDENNNFTGNFVVNIQLRHFNDIQILQDTQDLAIDDLAEVVSELAEG